MGYIAAGSKGRLLEESPEPAVRPEDAFEALLSSRASDWEAAAREDSA